MITVKLYGLLRIDHGIKQLQLEARNVTQVLTQLESQGIPKQALSGAMILVNGKNTHKRSKLEDGDTVVLMSPVAGG